MTAEAFRFDSSLPPGAFTRDANGLVFHCFTCAPAKELRRVLGDRYVLLAFSPPALFDRKSNNIVDVFTPEEWARFEHEFERRQQQRR